MLSTPTSLAVFKTLTAKVEYDGDGRPFSCATLIRPGLPRSQVSPASRIRQRQKACFRVLAEFDRQTTTSCPFESYPDASILRPRNRPKIPAQALKGSDSPTH